MRQRYVGGETLFADYAGATLDVICPETGEVRQAQLFVAALGASNYTYVEATWSQALPDWIASHTRAFAFFGAYRSKSYRITLSPALPKPVFTTLLSIARMPIWLLTTTRLWFRLAHAKPRDKSKLSRSPDKRALDSSTASQPSAFWA